MTDIPSPFLSNVLPVCPPDLLAKARTLPTPRVVIANAGAELPMQAAFEASEMGLMIPVFTGDPKDINAHAKTLGWDISGFDLIEAQGESLAGLAAAHACSNGQADIMMKGHIHSDTFLKSALSREAGLRTGNRLVHIFHMSHPGGGRPLLISDAAVNVSPDIETRQTATREMVSLLHRLGTKHPKIAFLSATETPTEAVPSSIDAQSLCIWAKNNIPNADFSGPLAFDLILSKSAAAIKGLSDDPVAGCADGVIVPDIVSGNTLFKAMVYLTGACGAGLVSGAKVPLLLTSRADPPAARLASIALAAISLG